jgi:hypothetical protein
LACTLFLTGAAWSLLVVQLPVLFEPGAIRKTRLRNTALIAVPMLIELVAAIRLGQPVGLGFVLIIWAVTFVFYIPDYTRLTHGYDAGIVRRLIAWQWIRTVCWTARSALLLWITAGRLNI